MSATSVGIIFEGSTITLDAASIGVVTGFNIPGNEYNEFRVDGLADTRELFKRSSKQKGQLFEVTVRYDAKTNAIADNDSGEWVITLPKQDSGSTTQNSYTFDGYVLTAGPLEGDQDSADGITQTFTIRLDGEIAEVVES